MTRVKAGEVYRNVGGMVFRVITVAVDKEKKFVVFRRVDDPDEVIMSPIGRFVETYELIMRADGKRVAG